MIGFTLLLKLPRLSVLLLAVINVFLLLFIYLGCYKTDGSYSSIYVARFEFNQTSPILALMRNAYDLDNTTSVTGAQLASLQIYAGNSGICFQADDISLQCTSRTKPAGSFTSQFPGVAFIDTGSNSTSSLDIVSVADEFARSVNPYIVFATFIFQIILFGIGIFVMIPFTPWKYQSHMVLLFTSLLTSILWGFASMWSHISAKTASELVGRSSMYVIKVVIGDKQETMTWLSFAFTVVIAVTSLWLMVKQIRLRTSLQEPKV